MSVTLDIDDETLAALPFGAGELERHMRVELACRYYAKSWFTLSQAAKFANLDALDMGIALGERGIPRNYELTEILEDVANAGRQ